jgi:CP family cyanate transporter-like MFS transporter
LFFFARPFLLPPPLWQDAPRPQRRWTRDQGLMPRREGTTGGAVDGWRLFLLWLAGADLRLTVLSVPPVLPLIHRDLGLDEKGVAALSGLPVLIFALIAVPGSLLIARLGARRAIIVGLLITALATALRGVGPSVPMLFAMTFVMGAGIAIMQPALPALVSVWFSGRAARATAVYANGLLVGETLGAALTLPVIMPLVGGSWQWSLAVWGAPVLITAVLLLMARPPAAGTGSIGRARWRPDWRDPRTWQLGLVQGGGGALYFACNAFLPDYLHAVGRPELINACLTALNSAQLPASFVILLFAPRLAGRKEPMMAVAAISFLCLTGFLVPMPMVMIASAAIIGFAAAFILILTLALPPLLAPADDVHRLSAGMMTISYALAFVVPLLGGAVWDATAITATAFLPGAVGALLVLALVAMLPPVDQRR